MYLFRIQLVKTAENEPFEVDDFENEGREKVIAAGYPRGGAPHLPAACWSKRLQLLAL